MWLEAYEWSQRVKRYCVPRECIQRAASGEADVNNQVDKKTCPVVISQLLSQSPLFLPNELMNKVAIASGSLAKKMVSVQAMVTDPK